MVATSPRVQPLLGAFSLLIRAACVAHSDTLAMVQSTVSFHAQPTPGAVTSATTDDSFTSAVAGSFAKTDSFTSVAHPLEEVVGPFAVKSDTVAVRLPDNMPSPAWGEDKIKTLSLSGFSKDGVSSGGFSLAGTNAKDSAHALVSAGFAGKKDQNPSSGQIWGAAQVKPDNFEALAAVTSKEGGLDYSKIRTQIHRGHLSPSQLAQLKTAKAAKAAQVAQTAAQRQAAEAAAATRQQAATEAAKRQAAAEAAARQQAAAEAAARQRAAAEAAARQQAAEAAARQQAAAEAAARQQAAAEAAARQQAAAEAAARQHAAAEAAAKQQAAAEAAARQQAAEAAARQQAAEAAARKRVEAEAAARRQAAEAAAKQIAEAAAKQQAAEAAARQRAEAEAAARQQAVKAAEAAEAAAKKQAAEQKEKDAQQLSEAAKKFGAAIDWLRAQKVKAQAQAEAAKSQSEGAGKAGSDFQQVIKRFFDEQWGKKAAAEEVGKHRETEDAERARQEAIDRAAKELQARQAIRRQEEAEAARQQSERRDAAESAAAQKAATQQEDGGSKLRDMLKQLSALASKYMQPSLHRQSQDDKTDPAKKREEQKSKSEDVSKVLKMLSKAAKAAMAQPESKLPSLLQTDADQGEQAAGRRASSEGSSGAVAASFHVSALG